MGQPDHNVLIGKGDTPQLLDLGLANRHGLITGATGTGKTVSLQVLAEGFSAHGVPVFMADVKGDLSGIAQAGTPNPKLDERARAVGLTNYQQRGFPTVFWDLFGDQGHPVRTTVSEMGPLLLARLLGLNETQEGVLAVAFEVADDQGLLLLDLKDLRALMNFVGERASELSIEYGRVSTASVGAIQRRLLMLDQQGGEHFFGEPALDIQELMRTDLSGQGIINVLAADRLMSSPRLYATFLLWLLSELFEELPEVGDPPKPRLVFFFDEAHLLFEEAPKALLDKVEQVVRLIRPPCSRIGPATAEERQTVMSRSPIARRYDQAIDRESAYEVLKRRAEHAAAPDGAAAQDAGHARSEHARGGGAAAGGAPQRSGRQRQGPLEAMITSAARSIGSQIGRQLLRGVLGSLTRR